MGADIDLDGAVYVLVGVRAEDLTAAQASAFRRACKHHFENINKSKGLDALLREALAELGLSVKDLTTRQLAKVRTACGIYRYLADALNNKTIALEDLEEAFGAGEDPEPEGQGASEESLGDVLVEVSNPRVEVQITTTGVMIRPKTGEKRLWLSTADAKFLAAVVNNRPGLVSNTWFTEGGE
ncbi:hypothetical protein [Corynebacterium matruchotii]|uniref:hypothetical protein n=1 Tax=Corynebacterium matruchotii TaxID=43768 RepID=UPI002061E381|nr:hypothetical protein [Corynebacterium matruchotii]DAX69692.1 MAG TPA: hypothetical protein [Caudoviricetes sp.]